MITMNEGRSVRATELQVLRSHAPHTPLLPLLLLLYRSVLLLLQTQGVPVASILQELHKFYGVSAASLSQAQGVPVAGSCQSAQRCTRGHTSAGESPTCSFFAMV